MRNGPITVVDRTRPIADKDYWCEYDSIERPEKHRISKGDMYVRLIYDNHLTKQKFLTAHFCVSCEAEMSRQD